MLCFILFCLYVFVFVLKDGDLKLSCGKIVIIASASVMGWGRGQFPWGRAWGWG